MTKKLTKEHLRKIIKEELSKANLGNLKKRTLKKESCEMCSDSNDAVMSDGLCPVCSEKITIESETPSGQLVGSCGDIFYPEEFEGMSDLGDLGDEYRWETDLFEEDESGKNKMNDKPEEKQDKENVEVKKEPTEDKKDNGEPASGTVIAQDDEGFLVVG